MQVGDFISFNDIPGVYRAMEGIYGTVGKVKYIAENGETIRCQVLRFCTDCVSSPCFFFSVKQVKPSYQTVS